MIYLLDTNTCIYHINGRSENIKRQIATHPRIKILICDVVKTELFYGAYKSPRRQENLKVVRRFCSEFESLPFDSS